MNNLAINLLTPLNLKYETECERDIWSAKNLGVAIPAQGNHTLNFTRINPLWLRKIAKLFIQFQLTRKTFNTCLSYLDSIVRFGTFLSQYPDLNPTGINRKTIVDYLFFLSQTSLSVATKNVFLANIRTFIEITAREEWLPITKERILFNSDLMRIPNKAPKFIPKNVLEQLNEHTLSLPENVRRMLLVLQETGRRISEICTLPSDCISQDNEQNFCLTINNSKTKKTYLISITPNCAKIIQEQQVWSSQFDRGRSKYLFPSFSRINSHLRPDSLQRALNELASKFNIIGPDGKQWHFHSHQFRHTLGTIVSNPVINLPIQSNVKYESEYERDIWWAENLGVTIPARGDHILNFTRINPVWLRKTAKLFIRFQLTHKAFNTCLSYYHSIIRFSTFLSQYPDLNPTTINRETIIDYLVYLSQTSLTVATKHVLLVNVRTFIEITAREEWLPITKERILFNSDLTGIPNKVPKFIPESVLEQLNKYIPSLSENMRRMVLVLQETGRRISEICTLPLDCITQDNEQDFCLTVNDFKMKKTYLIPITPNCAKIIQEQKTWLSQFDCGESKYLFPSFCRMNAHLRPESLQRALNELASKFNIIGPDGKQWHFHSHQFRHTLGTRMINAGVSQCIVQRYLGHESPEMTSRYAHIHDQTLKAEFSKFSSKMVNFAGGVCGTQQEQLSEHGWLKHNIMAQALPNGYCTLPVAQGRCPHANACLTCSSFRTDASFLPQHEKQLEQTKQILIVAKSNNWKRQIEMNEEVAINLEKIVHSLKEMA